MPEPAEEVVDERFDFLEVLRDVMQQPEAMGREQGVRLLDRIPCEKIASFIRFCYDLDAVGISAESFDSSMMQMDFDDLDRPGNSDLKHVLMCVEMIRREARDVLPESLLERRGGPCGRRINPKELEYKCLDCGLDPTSIMCVECFQRSPCVNHNYRLITGRGGCCDCGDPEAWKPESFCGSHACNSERIDFDFQNALSLETKPEVQHAICAIECIFDEAIKIAAAGLTFSAGRNSFLFASTSQKECEAVLEWVVGALKNDHVCQNAVVHCLLKDIRDIEDIHHEMKDEEYTLLEHLLMHFYTVPEGLRRMLFDLVHSLLVIGTFKRKFALLFAKLYVLLILRRSESELASKKIESGQDIISLSIQTFTSRMLMKDMLEYNFTYSHSDPNPIAFGNIRYPTVCGNVLNSIFDWILISLHRIAPLRKNISEGPRMSRYESYHDECIDSDKLPRGYLEKIFIDLQLIFRHDFTCRLLMDSEHKGYQENPSSFLSCFTKILRMLQGAEPVHRRYGEHVRFEQRSWFPVLILSSVALGILDITLTNLSNQPSSRSSSEQGEHVNDISKFLRTLHGELRDWFLKRGMSDLLTGLDVKKHGELKFRTSIHSTSFYLTLHRALARIVIETMKCASLKGSWSTRKPAALLESLLGERLDPGYLRCLIEHPLRIQALVAQVNSLIWVRNGYSLQNHVAFYHSTTFSWRGRDLDLLLVQLCLSCVSDGDFLVKHMVNTFQVSSVTLLDAVSAPLTDEQLDMTGTSDPGSAEQRVLVLEEMLQLLVSLTSASDYLGNMSEEDHLHSCIMHCLAIEDRSHSEIQEWVEQSLLSFMYRRFIAGEIDKVLPKVATRSQRPTDGVEVYRLMESCWPKININSFYFRTRKERYSAEIRLFNHYRSNRSDYKLAGGEGICRPPWLAGCPSSLLPPIRRGLRTVLRSSRLHRMIFILLHNAARAFNEFGSFSGGAKSHRKRKKDDSQEAGACGQHDSKVVARSSEMALRHCLNLLFLSVLSEEQSKDEDEEIEEEDTSSLPEAGSSSMPEAGSSSCSATGSCSNLSSWQRRLAGVEVRTDQLSPGHGVMMVVGDAGIRTSPFTFRQPSAAFLAYYNTLTESYYNALVPPTGKQRDLDVNTTGLEELFASNDPELSKERNVFENACKEYVIEGDAGFDDTSNLFDRRVSHVRLHAVSHRASILSLLIHLARVAPAEGPHFLREAILSLLKTLGNAHAKCRSVIESSRIFEAAAAGDDEVEVARKREEAARRKEKIMEEMRRQQQLAAVHHNLMSDGESSEDEQSSERGSSAYTDPLAKIEGEECSLCQETMTAEASWSRKEPSMDSWIPYDEATSRELEKAEQEGLESVEIFLGGEIVLVDLRRKRQSGPLTMGRSEPLRTRELEVRREEATVVIIGFARPAGVLVEGCDRHARPVTINSCGHVVHSHCLQSYMRTLEARRELIVHGQTYENANGIDMAAGEFLCPICRRISNITVPLLSLSEELMREYVSSSKNSCRTASPSTGDGCSLLRQARKGHEMLVAGLQSVDKEGDWSEEQSRARKLMDLFVHQIEMREMSTRNEHSRSRAEKKCGNDCWQGSHALLLCAIRRHLLAALLLGAEQGRKTRGEVEERGEDSSASSWLDAMKQWTSDRLDDQLADVAGKSMSSSLLFGDAASLFPSACLFLLSQDLKSMFEEPDAKLHLVLIRKCFSWYSRFYSLLLLFLVSNAFPAHISSSGSASLPQLLKELDLLPPAALQELQQEISSSSHSHLEFHCKELVRKDWQQSVGSFRDLVALQSFVLVRRMLLLLELLGYDVRMSTQGREAGASCWKENLDQICRTFNLPLLGSAGADMEANKEEEEDAVKIMNCITETIGQAGRTRMIQRFLLRNIQRGLVTLPGLFQHLVRDVYQSQGGGDSVSQMAVCLVCGARIPCHSSHSLLSYRPCISHARSCAAGLGIFLLLSKTSVMLVQDLWVTHWGSPFLDQYGEEDIGLVRGHKLFLDSARCDRLNELWDSQNLRRWNSSKWKKVEGLS